MTQPDFFPTDFGRWLLEHAPDVRDPEKYAEAQRAAFPGLDLLAEAKRALAWNEAQPPTLRKRAIGRFLNNWFARAFNQRRLNLSLPKVSLSPGSDFQGGYRRVK